MPKPEPYIVSIGPVLYKNWRVHLHYLLWKGWVRVVCRVKGHQWEPLERGEGWAERICCRCARIEDVPEEGP